MALAAKGDIAYSVGLMVLLMMNIKTILGVVGTGVLLAGNFGGWALYVKDNHLKYAYNLLGL